MGFFEKFATTPPCLSPQRRPQQKALIIMIPRKFLADFYEYLKIRGNYYVPVILYRQPVIKANRKNRGNYLVVQKSVENVNITKPRSDLGWT